VTAPQGGLYNGSGKPDCDFGLHRAPPDLYVNDNFMDSIFSFLQENGSASTIVAIFAILLAVWIAVITKGKGGC
jgi:hypothetical protein